MIQANRHLLLPLYQETIFYTADKYSKNVKRIRSFCCLKLYSGLPEQHSRLKPPLFHGLQAPCDLTPSGPSTLISYNHLYSRPSLFPHRGLCCPHHHSALLPGSLSWLLQVSVPALLLRRPFLTPSSSQSRSYYSFISVKVLTAIRNYPFFLCVCCLSPSLDYNPQVGRDPVHLGHHFVPSTQIRAWHLEGTQEKSGFVNTFRHVLSTPGHVMDNTDDSDPVLILLKLAAWLNFPFTSPVLLHCILPLFSLSFQPFILPPLFPFFPLPPSLLSSLPPSPSLSVFLSSLPPSLCSFLPFFYPSIFFRPVYLSFLSVCLSLQSSGSGRLRYKSI